MLAVKDEREDALAACGGLTLLDCCARRDAQDAGNSAQMHFAERVMRQPSQGATACRRCTICLSEYEVATGGAAENPPVAWGLCPEHRELHGDGFIAVIECDLAKSGNAVPGDLLEPEEVHRTGVVAYIDRQALLSIFKIRLDSQVAAVYVESGTVAKLQGYLLRPN